MSSRAARGAPGDFHASADMSISVNVEVIAAFVDERNGGNLAGVVIDRSDLSEAQMQALAATAGYSETAFLTEVSDGFRFDVFTPRHRVADCGHATVAAFAYLSLHERFTATTIKHTVNGPRAIRVADDGAVFMRQPAPLYLDGPDPRTIAASLGLSEATAFAVPPVAARHDAAFLLVPVPHAGMLDAIIPNMRAIEAICESAAVLGYYVFAYPGGDIDATARMFAPRAGIPEEPATGMAAGLLAAFLHDRAGRTEERFVFEQGAYMKPPSPSRLEAELVLRDDRIAEIWVGGHARTRGVRLIEVDAAL